MDTLEAQVYDRLLATMQVAGHRERGEAVRQAASVLGVAECTVYAGLRRLGWTSGRRARADKGRTAITAEDMHALARLCASGRNKRGQPNIPLCEGWEIAREHGLVSEAAAERSSSQAGRVLRAAGLSLGQQRAGGGAIARVSSYPNHVWVLDPSIAIQWYFRDENGRKLDLYNDAQTRFYKPDQMRAVRRVIHRYIVTDHCSGAFYVRYYYEPGESAETNVDFLWRAMAPKSLGVETWPFRGIPHRLVMDPGSANRSALFRNLLEELGIIPEWHQAGNARASGAVEVRHAIWQRAFEGKLALRPVRDLDELNMLAERECAILNGQRIHSRHHRPALEVWSQITEEQLVEAPERDVILQLASREPRRAVLDARLWLRADSRTWQVSGENLVRGQEVTYRICPFLPAGLRVWDAFGRELGADQVVFNELGFPTAGARIQVWDDPEHQGAAHPTPPGQAVVREVERDGRSSVDDVFGDLDARLARQAYITRRGRVWEPAAESARASAPVLGTFEVREEVARRLGRSLSAEEGDWWRTRSVAGLTAADLEVAWTEFTALAAAIAGRR